MPENEFEKKVSSEMQELRFKPSENVWLRVEERIQKKKKRRVFVIIFLLAGLALLGYWQRGNLFGDGKKEIANIDEHKSTETKESTNEINKVNEQNGNNNKTPGEINNTGKDKVTESDTKVSNEIPSIAKDEFVKTDPAQQKEISLPDKPKHGADKSKKKVVVLNESDVASFETNDPNVRTDPDTKKNNDIDNVKPDTNKVVPTIDSSQKKVEVKTIADSLAKKLDTVLKVVPIDSPVVKIQNKQEKKWKWGLHITPGISSLSDHSFPVSSKANFSDFSYSSVGSGSAAPPPVRQKPSDPKPGFAFQAGAFVQRELSSKTSLSLGLQYGYYSSVLRRDSLINNNQFASALTANGNFVNHYHFIELPILFNWQLNKNKEKPFVWSNGFTIGQLISSNAIMYDTAFNGIYYQNKKQLVKTQFSFSTGFSWTIANSKKTQWSLGPVVNIHLNKLIDNPFETKRYLFFAGLRTGILFNQKK